MQKGCGVGSRGCRWAQCGERLAENEMKGGVGEAGGVRPRMGENSSRGQPGGGRGRERATDRGARL